MDLIFAEASPPGRGGVSVIRLSGEGARVVAETFVGPIKRPRYASLRRIMADSEKLDQALVIWFEKARSFTGEEVVEFHLHGAPVILRRFGEALIKAGCRIAEPGEFTRRAFINGRMDLAEIEGLGDLLSAETEAQRRLALRLADGELSRMAQAWRDLLIRAGALVEASIDFADEDVPEEVPAEVHQLLDQFRAELDREIVGYAAAERLRNGFEVAVIGPPNAGKSSLINHIARREVALVSDIAGTTRDVIELRLDLKGLAVTFLDTAGLRDTDDSVEAMGVERARRRAEAADLRLHLSEDGVRDARLWAPGDISLRTKADLSPSPEGISVLTGAGISALLENVHATLARRAAGAGIVSHDRQRQALMAARDALPDIDDLPPELLAEAIRQSASHLDQLLGRIGAEEYLDVIFSSFCIGK